MILTREFQKYLNSEHFCTDGMGKFVYYYGPANARWVIIAKTAELRQERTGALERRFF